ncbi:MAG TPA: porin [Polyangia bacterium]|nr:porin [Polyangia bacterium]
MRQAAAVTLASALAVLAAGFAAAGEGADDAGEGEGGEDVLEVGGRVHVGLDAEHLHGENDQWSDTFQVRRARLKVTWRPEDWLDARVQLDAATAFGAGRSMLKDAWLRLKPWEALEIRGGLFKRPFSGLELTSSGTLRVIERGPTNAAVVDSEFGGMGFGDRDIGLELAGRLVDAIKLDWAVGLFNGSGAATADFDDAKDVVARIAARPVKPLIIGASYTIKLFDLDFHPGFAMAGGTDVQIRYRGFRAHVEVLVAQNYLDLVDLALETPRAADQDLAWGVLGILSQRLEIPSAAGVALEPVVKIEFFDASDRIVDDHAMLYTVGLNTYAGEHFRVMLDLEVLRAGRFFEIDEEADDPATVAVEDVADHSERLLLLLCFDI